MALQNWIFELSLQEQAAQQILLGISLPVPETLAATVLPGKRSYETYFSMRFVNRLSKEILVYGIQKNPSPVLALGLYRIPKEEKELLCYISPSVNT